MRPSRRHISYFQQPWERACHQSCVILSRKIFVGGRLWRLGGSGQGTAIYLVELKRITKNIFRMSCIMPIQ